MIKKFVDGRTDLVFELLSNGYKANSIDDHGTPLIKWCAYYGDVSAIKYLLANGADITLLGMNFDLNGAVFHGHWQLVQFLLENGADPNLPLEDTAETPLHSATARGKDPVTMHIVKLLLAAGANPNTQTKERVETGSFMRDAYTRGETPLHRAAAFCSDEVIQLLVDSGADVTIGDQYGDTPLSYASWYGRSGKILSLLCFGSHSIHPERIKGANMDTFLVGRPHL